MHTGGPSRRVDPRLRASAPFIEALRRFAELAYAPHGLQTPRWVLYDCAVIPGLVFGLAGRRDDLPATLCESLGLATGDTGPVPLSMLIAIPTLESDHWFIYDLIDVNQVSPGAWPNDLRGATLRAGIDLIGATEITSTAPWRSSELTIHAAYAPLQVLAAWVPNHDEPATAVFGYRPGGAGPIESTTILDVADNRALENLQRDIEAGAKPQITGATSKGTALPVALDPRP